MAYYTVYEYDVRTGSFKFATNKTSKDSINNLLPWEEYKNKFLLIYQDNYSNHDFHTIRTDNEGNIIEYRTIGPNNYDKEMLIDAIVGCKPTRPVCMKTFGQMYKKLIESPEIGEWEWVSDIKQRLEKMSVIRLIEVYKKLKS